MTTSSSSSSSSTTEPKKKPLRINVIDPKELLTPQQKQSRNVAEIRQKLERQFPHLRHNIYIRDDEDPLADYTKQQQPTDDSLAMALDALEIKETR